jgi:hypothetical protein
MRNALLLAVLACASQQATERPQQKPPELPPPPVAESGAKTPDAFASLVPGAIPAAATPEARAAWKAMCDASAAPGGQTAPVRAFELVVDVRYFGASAGGGSRGSNDFVAEFRFLAPTFVRVKIVEGKREVGRGPEGDWFDDGTRHERIRLDVGREHQEDRRQLDQWQSIAKDFVGLTDPKSLRIAKLETLSAPPAVLPAKLAARGAQLAWVRVTSPDFRLVDVVAPDRLFRAALGRDPKTGWVELALIEEDLPSPELRPNAALLELKQPKPLEGLVVPQHILVRSVDASKKPLAFAEDAGMDLILHMPGSTLRANFAPQDFALR